MLLNLKEINKFIAYRYFKMNLLTAVTDLMTQGCYMESVDIKDACYTVPIATEHQKFFNSDDRTNCINITVCQMGWHQLQESLLNS